MNWLDLVKRVLDWLRDHNIDLADLWPRVEAFLEKQLGSDAEAPGTTPPAQPQPPPPEPEPQASAVPAAVKLRRQLAGAIPEPIQRSLQRDAEGKYVGEESSVPLTGVPPESNAWPGFLWKPIGSATGRVSIYMPVEAIGKVESIAVFAANGALAWESNDDGTPGDDGRPFWRTDLLSTDGRLDLGCWVRLVCNGGPTLWYPVIAPVLRNGSGHGNAPPHLYPFVQTKITTVPGTSPQPPPALSEAPARPFHALMATDWGACVDLERTYGEHVPIWRDAGIDTIYVVGDLRVGDGSRPHIMRTRTQDRPLEPLMRNLHQIRDWRFRVIVVAYNEPSVRSGGGQYLGAFQDSDRTVAPSRMYSLARLGWEAAYWDKLLREFVPDAIVLSLEPSHATSVGFQQGLADHLRSIPYNGPLYANGFGDGEWRGGEYGVRWAPSTHAVNVPGGAHILNTDGYTELDEAQAAVLVPQITRTAAPDGWILWYSDYRGSGGGPSGLEDWMWRHIAR